MAENQGSRFGEGSSFITLEADCSDVDSDAENREPCSVSSEGEDFIDNKSVAQGNTLALYQTLEKQAGDTALNKFKRRLQLSPLGQEVEGRKRKARKQLFKPVTDNGQDEVPRVNAAMQVPSGETGGTQQSSLDVASQILLANSGVACKLALFKKAYTVGFTDLTRVFKHDKSTNCQWVVAGFGVTDVLFTASFQLLQKDCSYLQASWRSHGDGYCALYLCVFKVAKSRETVGHLFSSLLNLHVSALLMQPPKINRVCCALFWVKGAMSPHTQVSGDLPDWIKTQTQVSEVTAESKFDMSTMVQWAYDNHHYDESDIAYHYALLAPVDANARAWLNSANQAKLVKDAATMVKHYTRAETARLSISAYIHRLCSKITEVGNWLCIMNLLKHQHVEPISFINALRPWLHGVPKKNTIIIIGPPNTGKSYLCNSLISFLRGRVLSFANHRSHFWLSPLAETKAAMIDDATHTCLQYFDTYLRNFLDGYPVCIDRKHKTAVQLKSPPLLITSNVDVMAESRYSYLHSRMQAFYFKEPCPLDEDGRPLFTITDADWKSLFTRLWTRLDLSDQEDEGEDECSLRTFTCSARETNGPD